MPRSSALHRKRGANHPHTTGSPISTTWSAYKIPFLAAAIAFGVSLVLWLSNQPISSSLRWRWLPTPVEEWEDRRQQVKGAFISSWDAYSKYAWGYDQFHPISKKGSLMSPKGLGWIIVDSLDTMMIMNLTSQLADARLWLHRKLDYEQDQDVNTFETTIRMLGGLLSAHYLSRLLPGVSSRRDSVYLSKAVDLADRLLGAYDSPSGIPYASIHLANRRGLVSHADGGASSTAEATTLQLEMKYLSNVTGNDIYWRKAEKVMEVVDNIGAPDGLVPIFIAPHSGSFTTREIRLGSRGDSYYEYLIKQYLQTSEPIYLDMWEEALAGIQKHLIIPTKHAKLTIVAELPNGIGGILSPKMDHLVCFLPGSVALGATNGLTEAEARRLPSWNAKKAQQMKLARELTKTCWGMYKVTQTGLAPEIVWFRATDTSLQSRSDKPASLSRSSNSEALWKKDYNIKPLDAHNLQRPETVESLFLMWRITKDPIYREWGWEIFKAFMEYSTVELGEGFSSLNNVNAIPPPRRDNMESFWLAETLKYLYLLFSPDDVLPLTEVVFNTEAHVFPRMGMGKFRTGWQRKHGKSGN
ncbi:mannosyl-oligosaccharide 1,2-alpha-mannosidase [Massarina eburnea CBS 473.64]|uniref:alpha-1,2-Mannosidase n=1 Tax=Massarina eburnea CBS 473.64 TaxID=1395130 RepID=A0A6A6SET6_9PLEO|nr:mannosyl-oligosaccharide 1,2-alpha-mannosidase [Massarina eburnea CBS 473.64]